MCVVVEVVAVCTESTGQVESLTGVAHVFNDNAGVLS